MTQFSSRDLESRPDLRLECDGDGERRFQFRLILHDGSEFCFLLTGELIFELLM